MRDESAAQPVCQLTEEDVSVIRGTLGDLSKNFKELTRERKERATWNRLLRYFHTLEVLADSFRDCEDTCRPARHANRMLHEDEYAEVKKAWDKSQKAYSDVQARASLIPLEDRSKGLFKSLEKAYRSLKQAIDGASVKLIPERVHEFFTVLERLRTEVFVEMERFNDEYSAYEEAD